MLMGERVRYVGSYTSEVLGPRESFVRIRKARFHSWWHDMCYVFGIHEVRHYQSRISWDFRSFTGWFSTSWNIWVLGENRPWSYRERDLSFNYFLQYWCVHVCSDTIYSFEATTHIKDDWPLDEYCRGCNECLFFGVFYTSQLMIIDLCLWCLRGTYCNPPVFYYPQPISHDFWGFFKQTVQRMLR